MIIHIYYRYATCFLKYKTPSSVPVSALHNVIVMWVVSKIAAYGRIRGNTTPSDLPQCIRTYSSFGTSTTSTLRIDPPRHILIAWRKLFVILGGNIEKQRPFCVLVCRHCMCRTWVGCGAAILQYGCRYR